MKPINVKMSFYARFFASGALASLEEIMLYGNPGDSAPVDMALEERERSGKSSGLGL